MNTIIKRELILDGLGCAHCAAKIEREVRNITGVETAVVDFASSRLTIEVRNERDLQHIVKQAEQIARSIESDINIIYEETDDHEKEHGENHGAISANRMKAIRLAAGSILFGTAFAFSFTFWAEFLL